MMQTTVGALFMPLFLKDFRRRKPRWGGHLREIRLILTGDCLAGWSSRFVHRVKSAVSLLFAELYVCRAAEKQTLGDRNRYLSL
jgi:hypothetical protein